MNDDKELILRIEEEMFDYIETNNIYYIADLWEHAEQEHAADWFPILRKRNIYRALKLYLESKRRVARSKKIYIPPPKNSIKD